MNEGPESNCMNGLISRAEQLEIAFLIMPYNGLVGPDICQFEGYTFVAIERPWTILFNFADVQKKKVVCVFSLSFVDC